MLASLSIQNLAIVAEQTIDFNNGLTIITGETGAGKSILLNALNLVLGQRASIDLISNNQTRGGVSANFNISNRKNITSWLIENDLDDDNECLLRRTLAKDGRSKAFINSVPVSLNQLKELGELLIDIHSQNEHYSLLIPNTQMILLDEYSQTTSLITQINDIKNQHQLLTKQINELEESNSYKIEQKTLLEHFLKELDESELNQDELNNIEQEYKVLNNSKELIEVISNIHHQLDNDDGINQKLNILLNSINSVLSLDEKLDESQLLINNAQVQAQEAIYSLTDYLSKLDSDENKLQLLEQRINQLHQLANKHKTDINLLLEKQQQLELQLSQLNNSDEQVNELKQTLSKLELNYQQKTKILTDKRTKSSKIFADEVTKLMQNLGMNNGSFEVQLTPKENGLHLNGNESIFFTIQTNTGGKMQALNKIASGGELSRISLAIAVVSSSFYALPTVIFDEVDVGISGAIAQIVGEKLQQLSQNTQVICITHLPQVAALGHQHLKVVKISEENATRTNVIRLDDNQKIEEISRLLGGINISDKTRSVAKELINPN